jgi:hypothetical protein
MDKLDYADQRCLVVEDRRPFLRLLKGLLVSLGAKKIDTELSSDPALKACKKVCKASNASYSQVTTLLRKWCI